jgi:cysteinyl-tRNA synthetase
MNDNFNFSKVISDLSELFTKINVLIDSKKHTLSEKVFTLKLFREKLGIISGIIRIFDENPKDFIKSFKKRFLDELDIQESDIIDAIYNRKMAKDSGDYKAADMIRDELKNK